LFRTILEEGGQEIELVSEHCQTLAHPLRPTRIGMSVNAKGGRAMGDEENDLTGVWVLRSAHHEWVDTGEKILT
jgi:hypothetical protein